MRSSPSPSDPRVARYFHEHADDFDKIYRQDKGGVRRLRDRFRGTVVRRLDFVTDLARREHPKRVIDVGCGSGRFAIELARQGADVVGLDFAEDMLVIARKLASEAGIADRCTFACEDFLTWETTDEYDLSLAIGVMDYVADPLPLLRKLAEVTTGTVVVSFPRRLHPLVPIRKARLQLAGCPVFFYGRADVERFGRELFPRHEVVPFGRDNLLVGRSP